MCFYFLSERSGRRRPPVERNALYLLLIEADADAVQLAYGAEQSMRHFRRLTHSRMYH